MDDIETILNTLIYDGKVERTIMASTDESKNQTKLYRAVASLIPPTGLMRVPCGVCPVSMTEVHMLLQFGNGTTGLPWHRKTGNLDVHFFLDREFHRKFA